MKFLVPNYSCLQNPWLGGYRPQIPVLFVLCPQLNFSNPTPPPPEQKSWVRHCSTRSIRAVLRTALVTFFLGCLYPIYAIHLLVSTTVYSLDYVTSLPETIKYPRSLNFRFIDSAPQQSLVCIFRPHVHSTPDSRCFTRVFNRSCACELPGVVGRGSVPYHTVERTRTSTRIVKHRD